jgi:two-component system LytT family response regulator
MRVLIADDEPLARLRLRQLLIAEADVDVVAESEDGREALEAIVRLEPDLVLLDIQMPGLDGLGVVGALGPRRPAVIFVTAHSSHAVRAFEVHAVDYLLKPVEAERLAVAIARARAVRRPPPDWEALLAEVRRGTEHVERVAVRLGDRISYIRIADVDWVAAAGNYVRLHTQQGAHLLRRSLTAFAEELDPKEFVRIHRSTIVRLDAIRELRPRPDGDAELTLRTGVKLRVSSRYRAMLPQ